MQAPAVENLRGLLWRFARPRVDVWVGHRRVRTPGCVHLTLGVARLTQAFRPAQVLRDEDGLTRGRAPSLFLLLVRPFPSGPRLEQHADTSYEQYHNLQLQCSLYNARPSAFEAGGLLLFLVRHSVHNALVRPSDDSSSRLVDRDGAEGGRDGERASDDDGLERSAAAVCASARPGASKPVCRDPSELDGRAVQGAEGLGSLSPRRW